MQEQSVLHGFSQNKSMNSKTSVTCKYLEVLLLSQEISAFVCLNLPFLLVSDGKWSRYRRSFFFHLNCHILVLCAFGTLGTAYQSKICSLNFPNFHSTSAFIAHDHNIPLASSLMSLIPKWCWKKQKHIFRDPSGCSTAIVVLSSRCKLADSALKSGQRLFHSNGCNPMGFFFSNNTAVFSYLLFLLNG